jgi:type I restriction enzyme R subunit
MHANVREMIKNALQSDGVDDIFKMGKETEKEQDIFDEDYLTKIDKIKLTNTKIKLLQQLLPRAIGEMKKVNMVKGVDSQRKWNPW